MKVFFQELKSRRVFRVAIAYAIVASGSIQVIGTVLPIFHVRDWVQQVFVVLIALGFPVALMLAWAFDLTAGGIVRTPNAAGEFAANRRRALLLAAIGLFIGVAAIAGYWLWHPWTNPVASSTERTAQIPAKSIAVLPFANLSDDKENAFFTDGVQEEILNDLARIADLKVISRTSVMQYKSGSSRNMREIAQQLGVAHVLEGSVRRAGNRVRVTAQLIDARTDATLWSDQYDRDLADVFRIQSEIAETIVDRLQAQLSSQEKTSIETPPTQDMAAYDLFVQARNAVDSYLDAPDPDASLQQAVRLLEEALQRDHNFVLAFCYITRARDLLYFLDLDLASNQCHAAHEAIETAFRIAPDSAEVHLAMADHLFRCDRDYQGAQRELALARAGLPNSVPFFVTSGYISRRQDRWSEAEDDFAKAVKLDPRNPNAVNLLTDTYILTRRFTEAIATYDRAITAGLQAPIIFVRKAAIQFAATGDISYIRAALRSAPPDLDVGGGETPLRILVALIDRDYDAARKALDASPRANFQEADFSFYYPRAWYEAVIARAEGNPAAIASAFARTRTILEARLKQKPEDARTLAVLAQVDAGLGRKEEAWGEAQKAVELMPITRDAYEAPLVLQGLAQVYTWTGDTAKAVETIRKLLAVPGYVTVGYLRLDPAWAPLRNDKDFKALLDQFGSASK
ncbi:MAG: eukaryotic-like serine/threonine-protein kinase [Verrucomicrobiota bacterium]|jgi:TolB-like protein/predicted Zn-dependent protease